MYQTIFNKGSIPLAEQWLYFTSMRHDAIANNIANAETPKYKAMDAPVEDFERAMGRAIRERDDLRVPVFHFEGVTRVKPKDGGGTSMRFVEDRAGLLTHLENNVDVDVEMGKLVQNAMRHNFSANLLAHQFGLLREAIAERVNA